MAHRVLRSAARLPEPLDRLTIADLDLLPTPDLLALLLDHQAQAMAAVERALPHIAAAIEATPPRLNAAWPMRCWALSRSGEGSSAL